MNADYVKSFNTWGKAELQKGSWATVHDEMYPTQEKTPAHQGRSSERGGNNWPWKHGVNRHADYKCSMKLMMPAQDPSEKNKNKRRQWLTSQGQGKAYAYPWWEEGRGPCRAPKPILLWEEKVWWEAKPRAGATASKPLVSSGLGLPSKTVIHVGKQVRAASGKGED